MLNLYVAVVGVSDEGGSEGDKSSILLKYLYLPKSSESPPHTQECLQGNQLTRQSMSRFINHYDVVIGMIRTLHDTATMVC